MKNIPSLNLKNIGKIKKIPLLSLILYHFNLNYNQLKKLNFFIRIIFCILEYFIKKCRSLVLIYFKQSKF